MSTDYPPVAATLDDRLPPALWATLEDRATPVLLPWVPVSQLGGHLPTVDTEDGTVARIWWVGQDPGLPVPTFVAHRAGTRRKYGPVYWLPGKPDTGPMVPPARWLEPGGYTHVQAQDAVCPVHQGRVKSWTKGPESVPGGWYLVDYTCGCRWEWRHVDKRHQFVLADPPALEPYPDPKPEDRLRAIGGEDAIQHVHDRASTWAEDHGLEYGDPRGVAYDAWTDGWLSAAEEVLVAARHAVAEADRTADWRVPAGVQAAARRLENADQGDSFVISSSDPPWLDDLRAVVAFIQNLPPKETTP